MNYSVVIPFYNEAECVEEMLSRVSLVMRSVKKPYEILAVNDGSTDRTLFKIEAVRKIDPAIILVDMPKRNGQSACLAEGFRRSRGSIVISMDGDLQDDPSQIPEMLEEFCRKKADVLCGWRKNRNCPISTKALSAIGNFFQSLFFKNPIHDISCTFRIYRSVAAKSLELKEPGEHRFIPFILNKKNFVLAEKEITNRPRKYGRSKYSSKKAFETVKLFFKLLRRKP